MQIDRNQAALLIDIQQELEKVEEIWKNKQKIEESSWCYCSQNIKITPTKIRHYLTHKLWKFCSPIEIENLEKMTQFENCSFFQKSANNLNNNYYLKNQLVKRKTKQKLIVKPLKSSPVPKRWKLEKWSKFKKKT